MGEVHNRNTPNHKVKQINIKVISKYNEAQFYQTYEGGKPNIVGDFMGEPDCIF